MKQETALHDSGASARTRDSGIVPKHGQELGEQLKNVIAWQMTHSGNTLMVGMEPLADEEFFAGGPNGISPAWTVGHLACVLDRFCAWMLMRPRKIPDEAHDVFNPLQIKRKTKTKAETVDPARYSKADILMMFRRAQADALKILEGFDVERWNDVLPIKLPESIATYGSIWRTLGVHTFWHLGELTGCIPRFYETYTLNTAVNYFYTGEQ